jgi:hypothetical protein
MDSIYGDPDFEENQALRQAEAEEHYYDKMHTPIHEDGHAVVGVVLGYDFLVASLDPPIVYGEGGRDPRHDAIISLAGMAAERVFFGVVRDDRYFGRSSDYRHAKRAIKKSGLDLDYGFGKYMSEAESLVKKHRDTIERFARDLYEHRNLTGFQMIPFFQLFGLGRYGDE